MADREKVIKDLKDLENIMVIRQEICPQEELQYWIELQESLADAIALLKEQDTVEHALDILRKHGWKETDGVPYPVELLKEQEAVEPRVSSVEQRCGNCNKVIEMDGWQSCPWCGKRIDWKGWWKKNGTRN